MAQTTQMAKKETGRAEPDVDLGRLEPVIDKYRDEQGAIIPMLQAAQDIYGYLPIAVMERIAEVGGVAPTQIYGIVTFYAQFQLVPVGENILRVCHGTACHVNGAGKISDTVSAVLGIPEGDTTEDGKFTLRSVACLGCCSLAPAIMINDTTYGRLTPRKVSKILESF